MEHHTIGGIVWREEFFVIAGTQEEWQKQIEFEARNIIHLGDISDGNVRSLMENCRAFLFPSLYEGFGIPPLEALSADLPKLRNVDCAQVIISRGGTEARSGEPGVGKDGFAKAGVKYPRGSASLRGKASSLPVCGIMTTPYPCLVLRNGARVMEGAPFGDGIILKIEADSVTLTNSTGRFTG